MKVAVTGGASTRVRMQVCLRVSGLETNTRYELVLPAGTAYSTVSPGSALRTELRTPLAGVLDFTTSFPRSTSNDYDYDAFDGAGLSESAILELWYPQGFAADTNDAELRSVVGLQEIPSASGGPETPQDVAFNVTFRPGTTCDSPTGCAVC